MITKFVYSGAIVSSCVSIISMAFLIAGLSTDNITLSIIAFLLFASFSVLTALITSYLAVVIDGLSYETGNLKEELERVKKFINIPEVK